MIDLNFLQGTFLLILQQCISADVMHTARDFTNNKLLANQFRWHCMRCPKVKTVTSKKTMFGH